MAYRVVAMDTLGCVLEEYGLDCFEEVYQVTHPCILPVSVCVCVCVYVCVYVCVCVWVGGWMGKGPIR